MGNAYHQLPILIFDLSVSMMSEWRYRKRFFAVAVTMSKRRRHRLFAGYDIRFRCCVTIVAGSG